jgi:hypothetical protein
LSCPWRLVGLVATQWHYLKENLHRYPFVPSSAVA